MDSLQRLQGLHADLQAFAETRLAHIERLWQELEDSLQEFRKLLDKPAPTASEREAYNAGKIAVNDQEFGIGDEFRHLSRAVGTALHLDEVEAGKLLIQGHAGPQQEDDTYLVTDAVNRFHDRRDLLLQSLRIVLDESLNLDQEDDIPLGFRDIVSQILDTKTGPPSNGSAFALKCLKAMEDVENSLGQINEQIQSKTILTQLRGSEFYATLEFQKGSLFKQHEALGAILALLFRGNYTISEDLRKLQAVVKRWQRLDLIWVHYMPAFSEAFRQYGSPDGSTSNEDAKSLNRAFSALVADNSSSPVRPLQAVLELWWTAEYSGWTREPSVTHADSESGIKIVKSALDDRALEFLLLACSSMHSEMWRHPARQELLALLIGDQVGFSLDSDQQTSSYFYTMLMESIEAFSEAWITNMPDSIRQLKSKEDDERLLQITSEQDAVASGPQREHLGRMHLESFLVLIAFAFEQRPEAAEQFWEDADGNLHGFLQWSSKRQTVPRVAAFCEMLCAVSEGPENAAAAHKFLLDESIVVPASRTRRVPTMNYNQIFAELELYARKVHEKNPASQSRTAQSATPDLSEVESPVMLASYLRLIAHLSRHNIPTREYVLTSAGFDFPRTMLMLASGPIPSYLRATIFRTLEALLTDKTAVLSFDFWRAIDDWASSNHDNKAIVKQSSPVEKSMTSMQATLSSVATSYDQYDAFVELLRTLVAPIPTSPVDNTSLPFANDLGGDYRAPGIAPYVDFVCGQIFSKRIREIGDETQAMLCAFHCLDFIAISLESFNESYVAMLDKGVKKSDSLATPNQDLIYARCHPFARIMQWLFGADMNKVMLKMLNGRVSEIESCLPDAPVILTVLRDIDVINMVLDLQPTYFDVVRPLLKESDSLKGINFAGYASFEESVAANSNIILDLSQYIVTPHLQLCIRSLALLQKLTGSPTLNDQFVAGTRGNGRRLIDMLGPSSESMLTRVADNLAHKFQLNLRELESAFEAPGYLMKDGGLAFLNACLTIQTEIPGIAHLLLGFGRLKDRLVITEALNQGTSLFNAITELVVEYPDGEDGNLVSWLIHIKSASMKVLQHLWSAPVSTNITIAQLRRLNFLSTLFLCQSPVSHSTIWDGCRITDPPFWYTTSAEALTEFFTTRACLYDYTAREINSIGNERLISIQKQVTSTLQGRSIRSDGTAQPHCTIFDLFDFADLDTAAALHMPELSFFSDLDFEVYKLDGSDTAPQLYDIAMVRELLIVRQAHLLDPQAQTQTSKPVDQDDLNLESDIVLGRLEARNRWASAQQARQQALHNYVDMIISALESNLLDITIKPQFNLHILQIILPKLDAFVIEEAPEAFELARVADALLLDLSRDSQGGSQGRATDSITERLFQLFRICLEGIALSSGNLELRTLLYSICFQYLTRINQLESSASNVSLKARTNSMDCVRSASPRLISNLSDDAEDGSEVCRLNALNLLSMLATLANTEKSTFVVDAMAKHNVIEIVLEPLRNAVSEFANMAVKQRSSLLSLFESRMFLLLQVSRTRHGALALLEAGYIQACRDSMIFRADPDLGMDLETSINTNTSSSNGSSTTALSQSQSPTRTSALHNYFLLLSTTLRVLLSAFTTRGPENEQLQYQVRTFLLDHRANMVGVFKKAAGVNGVVTDPRTRFLIDECVKCFVGLGTGVDFVDFEDESALNGLRSNGGFT